jgi:hypothetical protein
MHRFVQLEYIVKIQANMHWSQSYDFRIYNYLYTTPALCVVGYLVRFKVGKIIIIILKLRQAPETDVMIFQIFSPKNLAFLLNYR